MKKVIAVAAVTAVCAPAVALAATHSVKVSRKLPYAGTQVTVSGTTGPRCGQGKRVTIFSRAFAGSTRHRWKGVPAVYAKVRRNHKWSKKVTISVNIDSVSTWYRVTARCSNRTLGHTSLDVMPVY